MPTFEWNEDKNNLLKKNRNVSFEMVIVALKEGRVLEVERSEREKYKHQLYYIIEIEGYAYIVPFVFDAVKNVFFLKTIYPSRKATIKYLNK